jgi:predicted metalloprotease
VLLVGLVLVGGACTDEGEQAEPEPVVDVAGPDGLDPATDDVRPGVHAVPYAELVPAAVEDIQAYFGEAVPEAYDVVFEPIDRADQHPYSEYDPPPSCGGYEVTWEEVAGNAYWCEIDEYVAWDEQDLFPTLYRDYGPFAVAMVLAHEWGHAVQTQVGYADTTIAMEQQADCFAGSWAADVIERSPDELGFAIEDLEVALGGLLAFRDEPGTPVDAMSAHGSGFDRINAFQEGFEQGAVRCAGFESSPPALTDLGYLSEEDLANEGNLAYDDSINLAGLDLNAYWESVYPDFEAVETFVPFDLEVESPPVCEGERLDEDAAAYAIRYCAEEHYVIWDDAMLRTVHEDIGDFAVATLLGTVWTEAAQRQLDDDDEFIASRPAELQRACFTGSWAGRLLEPGASEFIGGLSPGDLDESVQAFLAFAEASGGETGSAFQRSQAFRIGFYGQPGDCDALAS